jgi:hypothetical protein
MNKKHMKRAIHTTDPEKNGKQKTRPIRDKEQVQKSKDEHIDQDFPGYPHTPSRENIIDPKTPGERSAADLGKKNNNKEKKRNRLIKKDKKEKPYSNGSGGAFEATEESSSPAGESDEDNDDLALGRGNNS